MKKLSNAQILNSISELRKMAVLKKAISTKQKLLMGLLGLAGGTSMLGAETKGNIGNYWGDKLSGGNAPDNEPDLEMSDDDAADWAEIDARPDMEVPDQDAADWAEIDAMPDFGSRADIEQDLNAEADRVDGEKYYDQADMELNKLLGSSVADSLKSDNIWGEDGAPADENGDDIDMNSLFELGGGQDATPGAEAVQQSQQAVNSPQSVMGNMEMQDLEEALAGAQDLEKGTSQSVPMDLNRPEEGFDPYSPEMRDIFNIAEQAKEQPGTAEELQAMLAQEEDLANGSSQSVPMDLSRPGAEPDFSLNSPYMQQLLGAVPAKKKDEITQEDFNLGDYDPLLDEILAR